MDQSTLSGGIMGALIGIAIGILTNAALIWFIANYMIDLGDKSPFKKCIICALALGLVNIASYCIVAFVPFYPFTGLLALFVWYKGSVAAIEGSLEATKGGFTILVICSLVSVVLSWWQMAANANI